VLGSGMHAYGAGSGNLVTGMTVVALAEIAFIFAAWQAKAKADAAAYAAQAPTQA
jgi:hypothetical protein